MPGPPEASWTSLGLGNPSICMTPSITESGVPVMPVERPGLYPGGMGKGAMGRLMVAACAPVRAGLAAAAAKPAAPMAMPSRYCRRLITRRRGSAF